MGVEEVARAYSGVAGRYIELFGAEERVHPDDLAFIAGHLVGRRGRVLDVGCGPGHITGYLRSLGVDAVGIDVVPEFIDHARATQPGVEFRLGSMASLEVADHAVDGILAWYSLIHLPPAELDGTLAELRRALAPGGTLVLGLFDADADDEVAAFDHKVVTAYRWPLDEIAERLARAGFAEVDRLRRPAEGPHRPHAAVAATTTRG